MNFHETVSNAFSKSTDYNKPGKLSFLDSKSTSYISLTFSPKNLPAMKPFLIFIYELSKIFFNLFDITSDASLYINSIMK